MTRVFRVPPTHFVAVTMNVDRVQLAALVRLGLPTTQPASVHPGRMVAQTGQLRSATRAPPGLTVLACRTVKKKNNVKFTYMFLYSNLTRLLLFMRYTVTVLLFSPQVPERHSIDRAFVIAVSEPVLTGVRRQVPNAEWVPAVTRVETGTLPLYTQYLIDFGRHSHMEVSNTAMIGCFQSHVNVWRQVNETSLVLEEDGYLAVDFASAWAALHAEHNESHWDVVMLGGRVEHAANGATEAFGKHTRRCAPSRCTWFGTRGYAVSAAGARKLLAHLEPVVVQVDAYIALLNMYRGDDFVMLWSARELVHQKQLYLTKVWDFCLKCYVPTSPVFLICMIALFLWAVISHLPGFCR